jgi:hypothetical protein
MSVRECKWSDCVILLEYNFSCITGQLQAFYPKNKWVYKSISKTKIAKTIWESMNHASLLKEVCLPDWARRDRQGTKGDHVWFFPEERGSRFLQNIGTLVPGCVVSQDHNINYSAYLRVLCLVFCVTPSLTWFIALVVASFCWLAVP